MWYGPFPTLYKNRFTSLLLGGSPSTWNTQANGRFFLFGFLRKYDKLCAYYDHPPLWSIPHLVLLNIIGGDLGLAMWQAVFPGCDRPSKPRPSLTVSLSLVAQSCRMSKKDALYLCHNSPIKTHLPGSHLWHRWYIIKESLALLEGCVSSFYRHGQRKRMKNVSAFHWCSLILVWNAGDLLGTSTEPPIGTTVSLFTLQQSTWIMRQ